MTQYLVVARAQAGVRLSKEEPLILENFPTDYGPARIVFATHMAPYGSFSRPVPMGLMAQVEGDAPSLNDALQHFSMTAQSLCPILAFIGNSPISDMAPEIGYESTPGVLEREFFQNFLPSERLLILERRKLPTDLVVRVLSKLTKHANVERMRRVMAQYYQALRNWEPGQEVLALAHLWMGIEAITPLVIARHLPGNGLTRAALAGSWGIDEKLLDAECRKRLILAGNDRLYKTAKKASDGFEHGFLGFADLHEFSRDTRVELARLLREAIITELDLEAADGDALRASPFSMPGHLGVSRYLRGKLISKGETLAAADQLFPFLKWTADFLELPSENPDEIRFKMEDTITGVFAAGVQFKLSRIEVWGGQESTLRSNDV